jgi:hypothetical protein
MYKVKSEPAKNRIVITLGGILTINESMACKNEIKKEAEKLTPGFDVINDFSNLSLGQDSSGHYLTEIINFFNIQKVSRVVRVVGASEQAMIQFAQLTGNATEIKYKYVPTLREAEIFLEEKKHL